MFSRCWQTSDFRFCILQIRIQIAAETGDHLVVRVAATNPTKGLNYMPTNPPPNGIKFFATADLLELMKDRNWLVRVTSTINQHWQKKNAVRKHLPTTCFS
jgi:hypothetical protein